MVVFTLSLHSPFTFTENGVLQVLVCRGVRGSAAEGGDDAVSVQLTYIVAGLY